MHYINESLNANNRRVFKCSNGVLLRLRPVPALTVVALQKRLVEPQPPIIIDEERGGREYTNEMDPTYIKAMEAYKAELGTATTDAYLLNGVTVVEPLPDDILPLESTEWSEGLEYIGLEIPEKGVGRRLAWLKYYIVQDADLPELISAIALAGGLVKEEDVAAIAETFRDNPTRDANTESPNGTES